MRLITKTCCECTRDARYKSEVKDSFHKIVSRKKSPKVARKKTISWDAFFNNDDAVKSIKKASNQLRPGGTLCMMPKYVDAIEGRLKFCSTSSVIADLVQMVLVLLFSISSSSAALNFNRTIGPAAINKLNTAIEFDEASATISATPLCTFFSQ